MTTLHTLSKNPHSTNELQSFIDMMGENDELLLLAEGVYATYSNVNTPLEKLYKASKLYVLKDDLLARGMPLEALAPEVSLITYQVFVDLVVKHQTTYNWV